MQSDPRARRACAGQGAGAAGPPCLCARFAFLARERNVYFLAASQQRTYAFFQELRKDYHSLQVLPGYGHPYVFIGKNAVSDVFPIILEELDPLEHG